MFYLSVNWLRAYIFVIGLADDSGMFCRRISGEVIWSRWCRGRCKRWSELMSVQKVRVLNMNSHYIFLLICEREREREWMVVGLNRCFEGEIGFMWLSGFPQFRRDGDINIFLPSLTSITFFFVKQEKRNIIVL